MAALTLGGQIGEGVGTWGGRVVGGALGELFGPEAVPLGGYLGGKFGGYAGGVVGDYLYNHMKSANQAAEGAGEKAGACAKCRSRDGQTCDYDVLQGLEAAKDQACNSIFTNPAFQSMNKKKLAMQSCADVRQRLSGMKACRNARQRIQDECFKDNPDPGHEQAIRELDNGIKNMEALEAVNCAGSVPTS